MKKKNSVIIIGTITVITIIVIILIANLGPPTGGSGSDSDFPFVIFLPIYVGVFTPLLYNYIIRKNEEAEGIEDSKNTDH